MKKVYLLAIAAGSFMLAANANAYDSTGCGFGSIAWRGTSGPGPQVLAATTNVILFNQTFGISSGTSGCDPDGRVTGGTQRIVFNFIENNMEQYALDAAKGEGETLTTIAGMLNMDEQKFAEISKEHFAELFPDQDVDAVHVTQALFQIIKSA